MRFQIDYKYSLKLVLLFFLFLSFQVAFGSSNTQGEISLVSKEGKYFFQFGVEILNRDILIVSRIKTSSAQTKTYPGDQIGSHYVKFIKAADGNIYLTESSYGERAVKNSPLGDALKSASMQPYLAIFKANTVKGLRGADSLISIDLSDYLTKDNEIFFFDKKSRSTLFIGAQVPALSKIDGVKNYDDYISIVSTKTFSRTLPAGAANILAESNSFTVVINTNIILLAAEPMKARFYDSRIGYIANTSYLNFDANPQGVKQSQLISRWNLQPKPKEVAKYLKGILVEPENPIIFYIDPATPKKWVKYLKQGIDDWQIAFEQAGFKNAIFAEDIPADADWGIDDSRHSFLVYKASDIANANGPSNIDPRSGEILESHVNWYHNIISTVHDMYMMQGGVLDKRARKIIFEDELMGQLIRLISSHEIGHALGLRHNYGASSTVQVKNLRNNDWLTKNGHSPSIMDYSRFNYVAQPGDGISVDNLLPRIGAYDKWAIEWGYKWYGEKVDDQSVAENLRKLADERLKKDKQLWFGSEYDQNDPRNQAEDLGDDCVLANTYGIQNLGRVYPNILEWTKSPQNGFEDSKRLYTKIMDQYSRYCAQVTKNFGGTYNNFRSIDQKEMVNMPVPKDLVFRSINFLDQFAFRVPEWMVNSELTSSLGVDPYDRMAVLQDKVLLSLTDPVILSNMFKQHRLYPEIACAPEKMLDSLSAKLISGLEDRRTENPVKNALLNKYVSIIIQLTTYPSETVDDAGNLQSGSLKSMAMHNLKFIEQQLMLYTKKGDRESESLLKRIKESTS